jgi:hypothetical protein
MDESVFYCDNHDEPVAMTSAEPTQKCRVCGEDMRKIGWFEYRS